MPEIIIRPSKMLVDKGSGLTGKQMSIKAAKFFLIDHFSINEESPY